MRLKIAGHGTNQIVTPGQCEVAGRPTGVITDCATRLQCVQKLIAQGGCVVWYNTVPTVGVDLLKTLVYCEGQPRRTIIEPAALLQDF